MRRTQAVAVLLGLFTAAVLFVASPVSAQTGYPPGPCTSISGTQNVGNVTVGQDPARPIQFVLQLAPTCLFTPGAAVTVTVNGIDIPGKVANSSGLVLVSVTVVSATQLSIDDPVLTPAICGTNTVTARGASSTAEGGISTQTATFVLICPAVPVVPVVGSQGVLSRTGANSVRFAGVALVLVATGALAVAVTRRRRAF